MEIEELWVPIPGYPRYAVSNFGNVENVETNTELKPFKTHNGYFRVNLYKNGVGTAYYVHRLVAQAFFLNYEEGVEVKHIIEENKFDNSVLNLTLGVACRKRS